MRRMVQSEEEEEEEEEVDEPDGTARSSTAGAPLPAARRSG